MTTNYLTASADIVGDYRYALHRKWADGPTLLWVMLNPSTADGEQDDPTIRRCVGFSKAWGFGSMSVMNLYAYRATDPKVLPSVDDPIGPENVSRLRDAISESEAVVAAWGSFAEKVAQAKGRPSVESFCRDAGRQLFCLGTTMDLSPRHPLYVKKSQERELWGVRSGDTR